MLRERKLSLIATRSDLDFATMDLTSFSAKLEPFLLMGKSLKGAAAAKLIQDATTAPGVFVFAELLELPNIQEVTIEYQQLNRRGSYFKRVDSAFQE